MTLPLLTKFRSDVEAFLQRTAMAPSRFGLLACNDRAFVIDLRAGREPRLSTIEKVNQFMQDATGSTDEIPAEPGDAEPRDTAPAPPVAAE